MSNLVDAIRRILGTKRRPHGAVDVPHVKNPAVRCTNASAIRNGSWRDDVTTGPIPTFSNVLPSSSLIASRSTSRSGQNFAVPSGRIGEYSLAHANGLIGNMPCSSKQPSPPSWTTVCVDVRECSSTCDRSPRRQHGSDICRRHLVAASRSTREPVRPVRAPAGTGRMIGSPAAVHGPPDRRSCRVSSTSWKFRHEVPDTTRQRPGVAPPRLQADASSVRCAEGSCSTQRVGRETGESESELPTSLPW